MGNKSKEKGAARCYISRALEEGLGRKRAAGREDQNEAPRSFGSEALVAGPGRKSCGGKQMSIEKGLIVGGLTERDLL